MEETVTTTINSISYEASFWQTLPAAAYVLLGVIISGFFTIFSSFLNNKSNKGIKKLENRNSLKLKELENDHSKKLKELEVESNKELQVQNQEAQKAMRLLDDKIKFFSEFHHCFSEILVSGTDIERQQKIEAMRKTTYRVRLLAPSLSTELDSLDTELKDFANFYWALINGRRTLTETEKDTEINAHLSRIRPHISTIFSSLVDEM